MSKIVQKTITLTSEEKAERLQHIIKLLDGDFNKLSCTTIDNMLLDLDDIIFPIESINESCGFSFNDFKERDYQTSEVELLSDDEIQQALEYFDKIADCSEGISWDTVDTAIEKIREGRLK